MYGIVATLVYQFTKFMGEITVYSDIGAWYCEFVVHTKCTCIMTISKPIVWFNACLACERGGINSTRNSS